MTVEGFYWEVERRAEGLQMRVMHRAVRECLSDEERCHELMALYHDMAVFIEPPRDRDQLRRRIIWQHLCVRYPQSLNMLLSLTGSPVIRRQVEKGEAYAGAVLRQLLGEWLRVYGPAQSGRCCFPRQGMMTGHVMKAGRA
ncbi:hypothetical protein MLA66_004708 [Salmonella enterica]|nr:hypothetical protein [Salmonella enterica]EEM7113325.1 hypothetical protein [Salmonella enterica subsp. enterica serovar Poona]HBI5523680.1 hypothetical protein [Salmonella enterica subsp. enterica serovar Welikade]EAS9893645.1 hypothetical protein [Salmonella enterica]EEG2848741.1 hypothetical protein [Salmonella enterica]